MYHFLHTGSASRLHPAAAFRHGGERRNTPRSDRTELAPLNVAVTYHFQPDQSAEPELRCCYPRPLTLAYAEAAAHRGIGGRLPIPGELGGAVAPRRLIASNSLRLAASCTHQR